MFTQAMPSMLDALRAALPPSALGPMAQALGNCAQPLSHRGGINLPGGNRRGGDNGAYAGVLWDPSQYAHLFPGGGTHNAANYHGQVDMGDMNAAWNAGNRYDSQFFFPTNNQYQLNSYYGGPTVHINGGQQVDYITNEYFDGDTVNVNNITTETLNGDPILGPQGPPGAAGRDGERGAPGAPGGFFAALPPGRFGKIRYLTGNPVIQTVDEEVARKHRYIRDAWVRPAIEVSVPSNAISGAKVTVTPGEAQVTVPTDSIAGGTVTINAKSTSFALPTNAIAGGTLELSPTPVAITVPLTISFDPDNCTVNVDSSTTVYVFPSAPGTLTISGEAAATETKVVASTDSVTADISGKSASTQTLTVAATGSFAATVQTTAASAISVIAATTAASTLASYEPATGFVLKGLDQQFWERRPASVIVASNPTLPDVHKMQMRVYRQ